MAVFPQGLTQIDQRCTPGERRVLHQLKRCLEDDYLVWHDIPLGPKARQPDFVVLSPRWGVLLLEVKDWKRSALGAATRDAVELVTPRGRVTLPHPLRQARDYAMELVGLMQQDAALLHGSGPFAGKLLFPYGWGVVMSALRAPDVAGSDFAALFPTERTVLRDELDDAISPDAFQRRLWGMFTVHYPCTLTLPQRDRIRWHLFPEIRLQQQATLDFEPAAGAVPSLPDLMQVMDLQQEQVARTLGEGHRVIHGAAGSGKTMILIYRAQFLAAATRPEQPVLVLCFNRTLADRIDTLLRQRGVDERVQMRTFHGWCQDLVRSYQLDVAKGLRGDAYFTALAAAVERAVDSGRVPAGQYAALLIDEAHDFEDAWLRIARRMVSPLTNSLLVLYDDAQSIYQSRRRRFNFASVGIEARGRTSVLKLNYRNTAEVMSLAVLCAQSLLQGAGRAHTDDDDEMQLVLPATAGRRGALPVFIAASDEHEEAELLAERVAAAHAAGMPLDDIAVVCRAKFLMRAIELALARRGLGLQSMNALDFRHFDWRRPAVKLLTMHSVKGLEFRLVFVAGLQALPMREESTDEALRLLYVAMTRATHELVLSAAGPSSVVTRVRQALDQVVLQFSAVPACAADRVQTTVRAG
jgi:hypothetical protein